MTGSHALTLGLLIITSCLGYEKREGLQDGKATSSGVPVQNDPPVEAEHSKPGADGSAAKVLVNKGLELADRPGSVAAFGWGAAAVGVRRLPPDGGEETASLRN